MAREIKFRAWVDDRMFDSFDLLEGLNDKNDLFDFRPETVFMQYIGLKDKNGTEIYEGDILEVSIKNNYIIEFKWGEFRLYSINARLNDGEEYSISAPAYAKESTVIGNIYENPELMSQ